MLALWKEINAIIENKNSTINLLEWEKESLRAENEKLKNEIKELKNDIEKYKENEANRV